MSRICWASWARSAPSAAHSMRLLSSSCCRRSSRCATSASACAVSRAGRACGASTGGRMRGTRRSRRVAGDSRGAAGLWHQMAERGAQRGCALSWPVPTLGVGQPGAAAPCTWWPAPLARARAPPHPRCRPATCPPTLQLSLQPRHLVPQRRALGQQLGRGLLRCRKRLAKLPFLLSQPVQILLVSGHRPVYAPQNLHAGPGRRMGAVQGQTWWCRCSVAGPAGGRGGRVAGRAGGQACRWVGTTRTRYANSAEAASAACYRHVVNCHQQLPLPAAAQG